MPPVLWQNLCSKKECKAKNFYYRCRNHFISFLPNIFSLTIPTVPRFLFQLKDQSIQTRQFWKQLFSTSAFIECLSQMISNQPDIHRKKNPISLIPKEENPALKIQGLIISSNKTES